MTKKQLFKHPVFQWCIVFILWLYNKLIYFTISWDRKWHPLAKEAFCSGKPIIVVVWHGRILLAPLFRFPKRQYAAIISQHGDGAIVAKFMRIHGILGIRGSTSNGAYGAFKQALIWLKKRHILVITPDGPRGPAQVFQGNAVALAKKTGATIIPVTYSVSWHKKLSTWDRFLVPFPGSKGRVIYGEPLSLDGQNSTLGSKKASHELQNRLNNLTAQADKNQY